MSNTANPSRKSDVFVSIVCALENAEERLDERLRRLCEELRSGFQYYEILLVDNASTDGTGKIVRQVLEQEKNIQYCVLSSRKSESVAFSAGLDRAIGDFIILMDPRTDPPELIPRMLELATSGSEIVYGLPRERVRGRGLYDRLARLFQEEHTTQPTARRRRGRLSGRSRHRPRAPARSRTWSRQANRQQQNAPRPRDQSTR